MNVNNYISIGIDMCSHVEKHTLRVMDTIIDIDTDLFNNCIDIRVTTVIWMIDIKPLNALPITEQNNYMQVINSCQLN